MSDFLRPVEVAARGDGWVIREGAYKINRTMTIRIENSIPSFGFKGSNRGQYLKTKTSVPKRHHFLYFNKLFWPLYNFVVTSESTNDPLKYHHADRNGIVLSKK